MAQAIPIGLAIAGSMIGSGGTIIGANSDARELTSQAAQLDRQAGLERATAQRRSIEERRQARLAQSRALALAAAGGGASDPTVVNNIAKIEGEGTYRALTALYEGDESALGMEAEADARRRGAKATKTAGYIKAASTILGTGASLYSRYG